MLIISYDDYDDARRFPIIADSSMIRIPYQFVDIHYLLSRAAQKVDGII